MSTELKTRPRVRYASPLTPDDLAEDLMAYFKTHRTTYFGYVVKHHAVVEMHRDQVKLWSPRIEIDIEQRDTGSLVRGFIAPRPGVWAMIMALYGSLGFSAFFALIIAMSDMLMGTYGWAFYVLIGCILGIIAVYIVSQSGKKVAEADIIAMRGFLEGALVGAVAIHDTEEHA